MRKMILLLLTGASVGYAAHVGHQVWQEMAAEDARIESWLRRALREETERLKNDWPT